MEAENLDAKEGKGRERGVGGGELDDFEGKGVERVTKM